MILTVLYVDDLELEYRVSHISMSDGELKAYKDGEPLFSVSLSLVEAFNIIEKRF